MHLTHMPLNPALKGTRRLLESPQRMHAAVLLGFPGIDPTKERVLWRVDQNAPHDVSLLVASHATPDFHHIIEQAGWQTRPDVTWKTRPYTPFLNRLDAGQTWSFRVRVNPVTRRRNADSNRIESRTLTDMPAQLNWLLTRQEQLGFNIPLDDDPQEPQPMVSVSAADKHHFERRNAADGGRNVTIASVQLEGLLTVTDPGLFRTALTSGVGRAKAYGCGLMTLTAPVR